MFTKFDYSKNTIFVEMSDLFLITIYIIQFIPNIIIQVLSKRQTFQAIF